MKGKSTLHYKCTASALGSALGSAVAVDLRGTCKEKNQGIPLLRMLNVKQSGQHHTLCSSVINGKLIAVKTKGNTSAQAHGAITSFIGYKIIKSIHSQVKVNI